MATAPGNDPSLTYRSRMSLRSVIDLPSSVRVVRPLVVRSLLTPHLLGGGRAHAALQSLRHDPADAIHDLYGGDPGESVRIKRTRRRESVRAACRRWCRHVALDHARRGSTTMAPEPVEGRSTATRPEPVEGRSIATRPEPVEGH